MIWCRRHHRDLEHTYTPNKAHTPSSCSVWKCNIILMEAIMRIHHAHTKTCGYTSFSLTLQSPVAHLHKRAKKKKNPNSVQRYSMLPYVRSSLGRARGFSAQYWIFYKYLPPSTYTHTHNNNFTTSPTLKTQIIHTVQWRSWASCWLEFRRTEKRVKQNCVVYTVLLPLTKWTDKQPKYMCKCVLVWRRKANLYASIE